MNKTEKNINGGNKRRTKKLKKMNMKKSSGVKVGDKGQKSGQHVAVYN